MSNPATKEKFYVTPNTACALGSCKWPRQESNLDLELRKLLYYPLYYEAKMLFTKILDVSSKDFDRYGQQYYAKEFSHSH